jgi:glutamate-1-semialdehyde 2,1-aminomutase
MATTRSTELLHRASEVLPGGVNSPVRAFRAVDGDPVFIASARAAELTDVDGNRYIDYVGSWGPMIAGHAHPKVVAAVTEAMAKGSSYGAPCPGEVDLAEEIRAAYPSIQMLRLVSSGTEAVMGALRAARGYTGRDLVVKFEGAYHGGADYLLVKAGSGLATFGAPDSAGVPAAIASTTLVLPWNDADALKKLFAARGSEIAALILEPVVGNMGCVPPEPGFLELTREVTQKAGSVLVFDEVMTGFRLAYGGAQERYGITPDLTTLGKIIGGGLPVGAYGGKREIMQRISPLGPIYQAGTLSGNPLAVAAGLANLSLLREPGVYERLEKSSAQIAADLEAAAKKSGVPVVVQRVGSMLTPFFTTKSVKSWTDADACDRAKFGKFHRALLNQGVYWPPSQFEAGFVSLAHGTDEIERTKNAFTAAFSAVA